MSVDLLFELAWKSSICAGLTLLALACLAGRSAAERSRVAHAGLVAVLLLPLMLFAVPDFEIGTTNRIAEIVPLKQSSVSVGSGSAEANVAGSFTAEPSPIADEPWSLSGSSLERLLVFIPAALLLLLTAIAVIRLQRLRSRASVLIDSGWLTALARMQERFGFKHGTALLVSGELSSPISWGIIRPVILLDEHAAKDSKHAEAIVAHELAHVARFDWAKLLIGRIATALFWFNPLVWMLASRCHELREEAADDAVLRTDFTSTDYATLLVGIARHENKGLLLAANGVAPSRGSLSHRVMRVLDPSHSRVPARLGWTVACLAGALLLNAPLAAISPVVIREVNDRTLVEVNGPARVHHSGPRNGRHVITVTPEASETEWQREARQTIITESGRIVRVNRDRVQNLAPRLDPRSGRLPVLEAALIEAAEAGDRESVERLLAAGINVNVAVQGDGSPLIAAARHGNLDLVKHLLSRGAAINAGVDGDGNPLIAAAAKGNLDVVRYLLDRGADIEAIVPSDENALMQASYRGREDVVRLLIARGADVNSRDGSRTPLNMARRGNHPNIEAILKAAGALH